MPGHTVEILSTKALGNELISVAAFNNIIIDEISFIETKAVEKKNVTKAIEALPDTNATLVFTSANALAAIKDFIIKNGYTIFCIGNKTKSMAEKIFGEKSIAGFANSAVDLSKKIINNTSIKSVWFFCGDQRRDELPDNLKKNGIEVNEIVVYATIQTPVKITKKFDGVLFFSPSAVASFFSVNEIDNTTHIFAIGNTTASEVKHYTSLPVIVAAKPGSEEIIRLVINHFNNSNFI